MHLTISTEITIENLIQHLQRLVENIFEFEKYYVDVCGW